MSESEKPSPPVMCVNRGEPTIYFQHRGIPDSYRRFFNSPRQRAERREQEEREMAEMANAPEVARVEEEEVEPGAYEAIRHRLVDYQLDTEGKPVAFRRRDIQKWSVSRSGKFSFGRALGIRTCTLETDQNRKHEWLHEGAKQRLLDERKERMERYGGADEETELEEVEVVTYRHSLDPQFIDSLRGRYKV